MARYIARRVLEAIPLLLMISFILFALINTLGDPVANFAESGRRITPKAREELTRRLGLDKPIWEQYLYWLIGNDWTLVDMRGDGTRMEPGPRKGVLRGDFGISTSTKQPAIERIAERLPNTLLLMLPAYIITFVLALGIGIYSATHQYSFFDNVVNGISFILFSLPIFFLAFMCIYIFGLRFQQWGLPSLPIGGISTPGRPREIGDVILHMVMPVFCLIAIQLAGYVRFIRASMLEVLNQDYVRLARAKGLRERRVVNVHALKNAALPLVTLVGLDLPFLLAGAVVTEASFAWPGMGRLFIESLERADFPVLILVLMIVCVAVVVFQLLTDIVYTFFDPRIRFN
jgi:peptide/nickel transport system permease protein